MSKALGRLPSVRRYYFQTRYLMQIARETFLTDRIAMNDRSIREHEWNFGPGPDEERATRVLDLVTAQRGGCWGDVLEVGCAEGVITEKIAAYSRSVVAGDISPVARERAAKRLVAAGHVRIVPMDLQRDPLGLYDVVFAMDVIEYVHGSRRVRNSISRLAAAVRPGGLLVVSMCRYAPDIRDAWWQRWVPEGADSILPLISEHPALELIHCEPHPADVGSIPNYLDHLIAIFRRR